MEKYSLFLIKSPITGYECFIYVDTYDSLDDARVAQKEVKNTSLIMKTYE